RGARPPGAPADTPGHARVELRPDGAGRAGALPTPGSLRGRLHAGRGGGGLHGSEKREPRTENRSRCRGLLGSRRDRVAGGPEPAAPVGGRPAREYPGRAALEDAGDRPRVRDGAIGGERGGGGDPPAARRVPPGAGGGGGARAG